VAKALGLEIQAARFARADDVIELAVWASIAAGRDPV
jgi:hypothetical protein